MMDNSERALAADVAAGRITADVVLEGGTIVDVRSRRTFVGDVAFAGSRIAAVGDVSHCVGPATDRHDCRGRFVLPGLIDPHCHVAFSQLSVERLAELLLSHGTVALSSCFSESAAIAGVEAVFEQLRRVEGTGLDLLLSPFYVSAVNPGLGRFDAEDLIALVRDERCVELREWSDRSAQDLQPGLRAAWDEARRLGRAISGHLAGQSGPDLQASAALGVRSDHETTTVREALDRVRLGVTVQMRQGSAARDLAALLPAITEHGANTDLFSFCSDEQELADLVSNGHIDGKMRFAVSRGVAPIDAVRMATLNAATSMGVDDDYGTVVPGRLASIAVVADLAGFRVIQTFSRGRLVAENGRYVGPGRVERYPAAWTDTVHVARPFTADDFRLDVEDGETLMRVVGVTPGSLRSAERIDAVRIVGGRVVGPPGIAKLAVADRHQASGRLAVGLVEGLGIGDGAVASTVNAGAFELMVVGADEEAMALAANRAVELRGGIVVARSGEIKAEMALPLFGLVSDAPLEDSILASTRVATAVRDELGSSVEAVVPCAGFACLTGFGDLKMSDRGLVRAFPDGSRRVVPIVPRPSICRSA